MYKFSDLYNSEVSCWSEEKVMLLSSLQEVSRNPDCIGLAGPGQVPPLSEPLLEGVAPIICVDAISLATLF